MKSLQQPLAGPRQRDCSPDDLDGLLRTFFRAQVPEPWPVLKPPATPSLQREGCAPRRRPLLGSRFALAASLLILLIGQLLVSSMASSYIRFATASDPRKIEATLPGKPRKFKHAPVIKEPEPKPQPTSQGRLMSGRY